MAMNPGTRSAERLAFDALTPEQQETIIKKLTAITTDWEENFAQFEQDEKETAAQTMTEFMAEYGQDIVLGAWPSGFVTVDDLTVGYTSSAKNTAEFDLHAVAKEVAADMRSAKAQAAAEEAAV